MRAIITPTGDNNIPDRAAEASTDVFKPDYFMITPFAEGAGALERIVEPSADVFKPDLDGADFVAYEERQNELDAVRLTVGGTESVISRHGRVGQGLLLNEMHDLDLTENVPKGLEMPLAVLTGSRVSTDLINANLHGAVGSLAVFRGSIRFGNFSDGVFPRLDLRGVDARNVNFGNTVLTGLLVDENTQLDGARFRNAFLLSVKGLSSEHLTQADFSGAFVFAEPDNNGISVYEQLAQGFGPAQDPRAVIRQARVVPEGYKLPKISSGHDLRALYAENLTGTGIQLTERNMVGSILINPDLRESTLAGSFMSGVVVVGGTFDNTDMHSLWVPGSIFEEVSLRGVNLTGANLVGAHMREVDLRGAEGLEFAKTGGIVIKDCILPDGFYYENGKLLKDRKKNEPEQSALPQ